MKIPLLSLTLTILLSFTLLAQDQMNVNLFGQYNRGDERYSGSWSYTDFDNRLEYALLGTRNGIAIYSIDSQPIKEIDFIPGPPSNWREITVLNKFAYVTTEGSGEGEGMQIIDLSYLPDSVVLVDTYVETFTRGHIVQRDMYSEAPYVYVMGTCGNCGVNILDVSSPNTPIEIGNYDPGYYVHDAHIKGDYLYAAAFYKGVVDIVDIKDKTNPVLVAQIEVPGGSTHSMWTTEDDKHLVISGEKDGLPARIWNIEDLSNPFEVSTYSANLASLTHNPYIRGDYIFFSHNTEGLRVVDIADPCLPVEVGFYDTYDGESGGFKGLWSACPYFPSGKIIGGNREDGLYVWTFNNTKAGRLYATIKDAATDEILTDASFFIHKMDVFLTPDLEGLYKFGTLSGNFRVEISAEGYETMEMEIRIDQGDSLALEIKLEPMSVGLFDLEEYLPKLEINPNPLQSFTIINLSDFEEAAQLRIFNPLGQLARSEKIMGGNYHVFEKGALEQGIYLFAVYGEKNQLIAKQKVLITE